MKRKFSLLPVDHLDMCSDTDFGGYFKEIILLFFKFSSRFLLRSYDVTNTSNQLLFIR